MSHQQPTTAQRHLPYFPGIDGLRALAVVAVLLYHADLEWMQGGFLGVEIFFVISGFLITSLLCADYEAHGRINLGRFWRQRARRLLPALFVVLAATATFVVLVAPDEAAALRGDLLAALAYSTNWWFIFHQQSYFEAMGRPPPLQHLWSLAVEEQFYLVWPLICVAVFAGVRRYSRTTTAPRLVLALLALLGAAASAWLMAALYQPETDPSRLYYGSDTRASGLLIGAALALAWAPWRNHWRAWRATAADAYRAVGNHHWLDQATRLMFDLLGSAALIGLTALCVRLSEFDQRLYQSGFFLVALLSATLIVAVVHPAARLVPALLETAPLRWLGTRSYSIYLWHWPIIVFSRPQLDLALDGLPLLMLRLGLTLGLAELSFRLIEQPVRNGLLGRWWHALQEPSLRRLPATFSSAGALMLLVAASSWLGGALAGASPHQSSDPLLDADAPTWPAITAVVAAVPTALPTALPPTTTPPSAAATTNAAATLLPAAATVAPTATSVPTEQVATASPTPQPHIFALGDSVMVGAAKELRIIGDIEIDAKVSRQAKQALAILQARHDAGQLGDEVVIHIGTNGPFSLDRFEGMMAAVGDIRRVVVVNVKVPRRWEDANNAMLAEAVKHYPNVRFVDWRAASINRPELFGRDGIHLKPAGAKLYASLIAQALTEP